MRNIGTYIDNRIDLSRSFLLDMITTESLRYSAESAIRLNASLLVTAYVSFASDSYFLHINKISQHINRVSKNYLTNKIK